MLKPITAVQALAQQLKLSWARRTHRGFFMRSEDFFGYARKLHTMRDEFERELRAIEADPDLSDKARSHARMPYASSLHALRQSYAEGLDSYSHGGSYLTVFKSRFVPNGLYLFDEPEAPLSPMRQLGLLSLIKTMVEEQAAQFIIATHSPLLMAFPSATIWSFDGGHIHQLAYDELTLRSGGVWGGVASPRSSFSSRGGATPRRVRKRKVRGGLAALQPSRFSDAA